MKGKLSNLTIRTAMIIMIIVMLTAENSASVSFDSETSMVHIISAIAVICALCYIINAPPDIIYENKKKKNPMTLFEKLNQAKARIPQKRSIIDDEFSRVIGI